MSLFVTLNCFIYRICIKIKDLGGSNFEENINCYFYGAVMFIK